MVSFSSTVDCSPDFQFHHSDDGVNAIREAVALQRQHTIPAILDEIDFLRIVQPVSGNHLLMKAVNCTSPDSGDIDSDVCITADSEIKGEIVAVTAVAQQKITPLIFETAHRPGIINRLTEYFQPTAGQFQNGLFIGRDFPLSFGADVEQQIRAASTAGAEKLNNLPRRFEIKIVTTCSQCEFIVRQTSAAAYLRIPSRFNGLAD